MPEAPFTHGVASFDPTADSVLLWTRAVGAGHVRWRIAPAGGGPLVAEGDVAVDPDADHCVTVTAGGLSPATPYRYWFEAGATRSPTGATRTLPATGDAPFRMAVVCCGDYSRGHFGAYRAAADEDVDLVLHVGDYIYETRGKGTVRQALPDHEVLSLDDYRTRYAQARVDADLLYLHQRHPVVAIWDDHDIADNAWRHGAKHHDPNEHGPWEERLQAAARAHQEWLPGRLTDPGDVLRVYRSFTVGDLAEVVLLDTRIVGRDPQADEESALPWDDPARSLLGDEQRSWAHARVKDTTRPWCLLVSGVVLNRMELPVETGAKLGDLAPSGYAVVGGQAMCTDEWDGYPAERTALTAAVAERGPGVVTLSGDVHSAWAFEGPCGEDGAPVAVEFVAPCITATPMARQLPPGWRKLLGRVAERLPEARWFELEHHGYLVVTVDPAGAQADWHTVDTEDPEARTLLAASWRHPFLRPGRLEEITTQTATPPTQRRRQRRRIAAAGGLAAFVAFLGVLRRRRRT